MKTLNEILAQLPSEHSEALQWFVRNANKDLPWTPTLDNGTRLVTQAKGIYKPENSDYALSVRQVLNGPYPDKEPIKLPDGSWLYKYFQEGIKLEERDTYYTNVGLMACMRDSVPVGVLRQTKGSPNVRYQVLGLAMVTNWDKGYFLLEGLSNL